MTSATRHLVLVHAFPAGARMFRDVALPTGWRLLTPPLPGFDGTPLPLADSTSLDGWIDAVLTVLDGAGVDRFVMGGVSMGGYVACGLWRRVPARCQGLVLVDTRAGADSEAARAGRDRMEEMVHREGVAAVANEMVPKLLGETTRREHPDIEASLRGWIGQQTREAIASAVVHIRDRPDATDTLRTVTVPTLIVVGDEDVITPPPEAEIMHALVPNSRLVRLPHSGHLPPLEVPAEFNRVLAEFLATV